MRISLITLQMFSLCNICLLYSYFGLDYLIFSHRSLRPHQLQRLRVDSSPSSTEGSLDAHVSSEHMLKLLQSSSSSSSSSLSCCYGPTSAEVSLCFHRKTHRHHFLFAYFPFSRSSSGPALHHSSSTCFSFSPSFLSYCFGRVRLPCNVML